MVTRSRGGSSSGRSSGGSSKSKTKVTVDMAGVEAGGRTPLDGSYLLEVTEVTQEKGDESGKPYLKWEFKVVEDDKYNDCKVWHNTSLQPQALFNLRGLLEAMGTDVPDGKLELDLEEVVGNRVGAELVRETYQGKPKAKPVEFFPESEFSGEGGGEGGGETSTSSGGGSSSGKDKKDDKKKNDYEPKLKDNVKFEVDGDELEGIVKKIDGDEITVKAGKEEYVCEPGELTLVED